MSEDINVGAISEALNDKLDRDLRNAQTPARTIVETYNDNNGNWYEVYSDGWLRQGGFKLIPSTQTATPITLLKLFANTDYVVLITNNPDSINWATHADAQVTGKSVSAFNVSANVSNNNKLNWIAEGQGAN